LTAKFFSVFFYLPSQLKGSSSCHAGRVAAFCCGPQQQQQQLLLHQKKNLTTTCDIAGSKEGMVRKVKGAGKLYRNPLRALTYQQTSIVSNNNNNKRNNNHMMVRHITHTHCDRILGNSQTRVKVNFRLEIELAPASYFVFMINCTHYVVCVCVWCVCVYLISQITAQKKT